MPRSERLDRGDARNDVVVDVDALGDHVKDAQGAVVQRRVAPGQEGPDAVVAEFVEQGLRPEVRARRVPGVDGLVIVAGLGALGVGKFDEAVAGFADEPGADLAAQRDQIVLLGALVHGEEHVGVVQRGNGLRRDVVGVTRSDADYMDASDHGAISIRYRGY